MAEVLLFHHAHGLTSGIQDFAGVLRQAGHTVHVPDLYRGNVFETLEGGLGYAQDVGFAAIMERGRAAAESLPAQLVYAGFSLGVMAAQMLAQTRAGASGAVLFHSCLPISEFGAAWPREVPVQIHAMEEDPFFVEDGDIDAARELTATAADAELFLYAGSEHLFADNSLRSYDAAAARLLTDRTLGFFGKL
ncbi:dienelactone hydrolase family protein [Arthrobacter pigmenti]